MAIDRRAFVLGTALLPMAAGATRAGAGSVFAGARGLRGGGFALSAFEAGGGRLWDLDLPARGHGLGLAPDGARLVLMARRPGDYGLIVSVATGTVEAMLRPADGFRFNGHAVFSPDGQRLFATATRVDDDSGWLLVFRDAGGWDAVDAWSTHGTDPHELLWIDAGLVVANGGLPEGKTPVDVREVETSIAVIDGSTGRLRRQIRPPAGLRTISLRHMARASGKVFVAGQEQGKERGALPLLAAFDGRALRYFPPMSLAGYCGSVAASGDRVCVTSPVSGRALVVDARDGRVMRTIEIADVCGAAADRSGEFMLTGGRGDVRRSDEDMSTRSEDSRWDNHLLALPPVREA